VQGVFFRASAKEMADELGVKGFVRNEPDGSVVIEAEGIDEALHEFTLWCRVGPKHARVRQVEIEKGEWVGFDDFRKIASIF
jgi:acylphosphatase